jgi:predicted ATPase
MVRRLPPLPATSLLGRDADVRAVAGLFRSGTRVVTVTGPGGTGKTRLAIAIDRLEEEGRRLSVREAVRHALTEEAPELTATRAA